MLLTRADDGSLTVHSPIPLTDGLKIAAETLGGGVGDVIASKGDQAAETWAAAFPTARLVTPIEATAPDELPSFEVITVDGAGRTPLDQEPSHVLKVFRTIGRKLRLTSGAPPTGGLRFFLHVKSKTLLCGDAWWNYPTSERPAGEGAPGADGTGSVHVCSKVAVDDSELPSARVPRRTRAWAALQNKLLWPARRSTVSQGGVNIAGWVLKAGGRPPDAAKRLYQRQVEALLALDFETLVPSHGDVLRGQAACREALRSHFLPAETRSGTPIPLSGTRGHDGLG